MINLSQRLIVLLVLLIPNFLPRVYGQQDSASTFPDGSSTFESDLIEGLPLVDVNDILELNSSLFNASEPGSFYSNGFKTSADYTWFDGVPFRFTEEMPLRLVGSAQFNSFEDYFDHGNSLAGFCNYTPVSAPDSFSFRIESNAALVHKQFNDADIRLILSGPLWVNKSGSGGASISYMLASRLFSSADPNPSYISRDQASDDYLNYLYNNPLRPAPESGGTYPNALFTEATDAVSSFFNSNAAKKGYSIYGDIQTDLQHGISIKLGSYTLSKKETVPVYENYFFNQDHNPEKSTLYSNNYLRFEQQFNAGEPVSFHYQVQGQYSYYHSITQDPNFGKDYFTYGYAGKFETYKAPTFQYGSDSVNGNYYDEAWILNSWDYDTLVEFTPGNLNPGLSAYTSSYYSIYEDDPFYHFQNLDQVQLGGGLLNGQQPDGIYGLYNNSGTAYNEYAEQDKRQIKIFASGDLVIGKHKINIGFQFNRDSYSSYRIDPTGLWTLMRSLANYHIKELDINQPYVHDGELLDTIFYPRKYDGMSQAPFDKKLREALGLDPEGLDFIDIDSYDFNTNSINYFDKDGIKHTINCGKNIFTLDMFTADELLNDGIGSYVGYQGYDFSGNRCRNKVSFNDFFTATNDQGEYLRQVSSYNPMNYSAYAEYQLNLRGWSITAGFRLDAFDANQQVPEDPYLFYKAYTVGDLASNASFSYTIPSGIGNDFVVYVDNVNNPHQITGFRDGDQWYDSDGNPISNPNPLDVGSGVSPYLKNPGQERIRSDVFIKNKIFFNFLPQVSIQKMLNKWLYLSFRYNSSVQNPIPEITFSNPAVYYFFDNLSGWIPNPDLKPERTDKFRAGLSVMPLSGFVISAEGYADRYNNMIYPARRVGAYPKDYTSFDNADDPFFQYGADLAVRHNSGKTSGFNYGLSYHLLINDDNPSYHLYDYLVPKNLLKGYLQFNTGFGKDYLGPSGSVNYSIFESLGLSLYGHLHSGVYYMKIASPDSFLYDLKTQSATMPAQAYLDVKIEKGFHFKNDRYMLNFYCTIQNLFNSRMLYKVYRYTGKPDDNGYLSAAETQKEISEAVSEEAYRYLYANYINDPRNYGLPRRTTLGLSFSF
jgi:hypothetical protein